MLESLTNDPNSIVSVLEAMQISSVMIGISTGLLTSVIFFYYTRKKLPNISISDDLITDCDPVTRKKTLTVKFVNLSKNPLISVSVLLYGDYYHNDNKSMGSYTLLSTKKVPFVPGFDEKDSRYKYAIQASLLFLSENDSELTEFSEKYHSLSIKVVGEDAFYGTHAAVIKTYEINKIKQNRIFELGKNTNSRESRSFNS